MHSIQPIQTPSVPAAPAAQSMAPTADTFQNLLINGLQQVDSSQQMADQAVQHLSMEQHSNPTEFLTAVQQADMSLKTMIQVRNQLVQAYEQLKSIDL